MAQAPQIAQLCALAVRATPRGSFCRPTAFRGVVVLRRYRTIVPPAGIPHALEQRCRMTANEVDVAAERFFQQTQNPQQRAVGRHALNGCAEVSGQIEHHPGLGLCFEKCQIGEQLIGFLPISCLQKLPGKFVDFADIGRPRCRWEGFGSFSLLFETRLTPDNRWFLDTYLQSGAEKKTLYAEKFLHPIGTWHHAAIVVDGKSIRHFVDGKLELAGDIPSAPLAVGQTSVGMRYNQVFWYHGQRA